MSILLVGLNHNTAPIELRERLALDDCALRMAFDEFRSTYLETAREASAEPNTDGAASKPLPKALSEFCILSTCNRFEAYAVSPDSSQLSEDQALDIVIQFLSRLQNIPLAKLRPHLYIKVGQNVVTHLMRVAAGLDSLILGEPQILGQVHRAYRDARLGEVSGPVLSHLFMQAVHTGKRARSETDISRYTTSISHAAANLAGATLGDLSAQHVLVVGAGEMAQLAAAAIKNKGAQRITVINRTYSAAEQLAGSVGGDAVAWDQFHSMLQQVDLVLSATGAPHLIVHQADVAAALPARKGRPLVFFDVALPRDVEHAVAELDGVICYDVDDLQAAVDENLTQRQSEAPRVEAIIAQEAAYFHDWLLERQVVPVLVDMRQRARIIADAEVADAERRLHNLTSDDPEIADAVDAVVERMAHRLVNKLLHEPTIRLKEHAAAGDGYAYADAVRDLFALKSQRPAVAPGSIAWQPSLAQPTETETAPTPDAAHHGAAHEGVTDEDAELFWMSFAPEALAND